MTRCSTITDHLEPVAMIYADHMVKLAHAVATVAHNGQKDKAGLPYITHPVRVAERLSGGNQATQDMVVALLHDTLEDTNVTPEVLYQFFPAYIVEAVRVLTHDKAVPNDVYWMQVKTNPLALRVKLADIADNTDPIRLGYLDEATQARLKAKYARAREALLS